MLGINMQHAVLVFQGCCLCILFLFLCRWHASLCSWMCFCTGLHQWRRQSLQRVPCFGEPAEIHSQDCGLCSLFGWGAAPAHHDVWAGELGYTQGIPSEQPELQVQIQGIVRQDLLTECRETTPPHRLCLARKVGPAYVRNVEALLCASGPASSGHRARPPDQAQVPWEAFGLHDELPRNESLWRGDCEGHSDRTGC